MTVPPPRGLVSRLLRSAVFGQIVRFGMMSATSAGITVGLPVLLHEVGGVAPQIGTAIAFAVAFVVNFVSLRRLVFQSASGTLRDLGAFTISSLAFRAFEYCAFLVLFTILHVYYVVALVCVLVVSTILKFFWYRRIMHKGPAVTEA